MLNPSFLDAMPADPPRLFLITPPISDSAAFAPILASALASGDVACVLLRTEGRDDGETKKIIRALAPLAQNRGVALLLEGDDQLAIRANADGRHVLGAGETLKTALKALHPDRIVGAGGVLSRDAAMTAGEAGADYVMLGGPGGLRRREDVLARVAWWAEIFNVSCVGYAHELADASALAEAGADFIAFGDAVFDDPRGPAAALADVAASIAKT
ncbi:MAG: thiamine phosphate synthase, partial [Roseiarcus sp.]